MNAWADIIVLIVALQRVLELVYAERNTKKLLARGAIEIGREHYPLIVALHASWLVAVAVMAPVGVQVQIGWLLLFMALQAARIWVVTTLGPYWTTRIITLPGAPLVKTGPFRFVRHPNYCVVAGEIAVFPLVFGEWGVAIVFTLLNAAILALRISEEDKALAQRRGAGA